MAEFLNFFITNASTVLVGTIAYFVLLWLSLVNWTANDISKRPASLKLKIFSLALVIVGSIFGFIVYLIIRPQTTYEEENQAELERRVVEAQIKGYYCRACEFPVKEDFLLCPNCLKKLKNVCGQCTRLLEVNWLSCPYCGHIKVLPDIGRVPALTEGQDAEILPRRGRGRPKKIREMAVPVKESVFETQTPSETVILEISEKVMPEPVANLVTTPNPPSELITVSESRNQPAKRGRGRPRKYVN